ncbi:MAG: hypothetical protein FJ267_20005 [Planctomycetes bacterium]|nr:hypothetical protein [Planctomycetota bacterium]
MIRSRAVIFEFLNGGTFALTTALRHPDRFAAVFSFSPPKLANLPDLNGEREQLLSVYLSSGNLGPERAIRKNV